MNQRSLIFVSHANPEDNEFTRWLALKLAAMGYRVWSDVTRFLGGEDFWSDIESAIRTETVRFLYVLSRASNHKEGSLRELKIAETVKKLNPELGDFIIPVRLDDLPYEEINIELARLIAVDFSDTWTAGLTQLVKKFEQDKVTRDDRYGHSAVAEWWKSTHAFDVGVRREPERHFSNWYQLVLPDFIFVHSLYGLYDTEPVWQFPVEQRPNGLLTFAPPEDVTPALGTLKLQTTVPIPLREFLYPDDYAERTRNRNSVTKFINTAWESHVGGRLATYLLSNHRAFAFDRQNLPDPDVKFVGIDGKAHRRGLMGFRTMPSGRLRHWHFAVSARPALHPEPMLSLRSHVLFSDDGENIWTSVERMHKARRSQCKQWWNDDWRDRQLATISWLASGQQEVLIPLATSVNARLPIQPVAFDSPVTLDERALEIDVDAPEDAAEDEDDAEEDEAS